MITRLSRVTILVRDQDEALRFYTEKLGLEKRADDSSMPGFRWLTVAPKGQKELEIVLLKADGELLERVGQGATWVFYTDDCRKDYEIFSSRGVRFLSPPEERPYGIEAIFQDLYGNGFSLLQPRLHK